MSEENAPRVDRVPVEGTCPRCNAAELHEYPVLSEGGWYQVRKCRNCLHSVTRERWTLLGPITLASAAVVI